MFCDHQRVAERCHECECQRLRELVRQLAERLLAASEVIGMLAERKEARSK